MENVRVRFVTAADVKKRRPKKLTPEEQGIQARLEHLYDFKALIERLFGTQEFMNIKMGGSLAAWKKCAIKLLDAIALSIRETIKVADEDWFDTISKKVADGKVNINNCKTIEQMLSSLSVALVELSFLQIGGVPKHYRDQPTPLVARFWNLSHLRTVQYIQSAAQRKNAAQLKADRNDINGE